MPDFATVVYTIRNIKVSRLNVVAETYDTVSYSLSLGSEMSFTFTADQDQLKSYGMLAALLSILTGIEGTLNQAAIDPPVLNIIAGQDAVSSGSTPNQVRTMDVLAGNSGLPYFGAVGDFATDDGGNVMVGLRKCKLDTFPAWTVEQNKFRIAEVAFKAIPLNTSGRKLARIRSNETATAIIDNFNTFFV
jgi:hypothetical protein